MPFYSNTTQGTVNYSPGTINASLILPNDTAANNDSSTLTAVNDFKLAVGKYERFILKYTLFTTHDNTSDIRVKVDVPASPTIYRAQIITGGDEGTTTLTAEGNLDLTTDTANDIAEVKVLVQNGANAGDIAFSFAERANGAGLTILGGSYLEYIKF